MATAKGNLKVTLAIFSGRPDPEWQVHPSDPNYKEIERLLGIARSGGFIRRIQDMPSRLGYKGFLVHDTAKKNAQPELILGPHTVQLQQLLLKTVPDGIFSEELLNDISKEINTGAATPEAQVVTASSDSTSMTTSPGSTPGNLKVSLAIFSGRRDPEWQVLPSDPNYKEIERLLGIARSGGFIYRHQDMPARLGYKGFLVQDTANKNAQPELVIGPHTVQLQQLLLKTAPDSMLPEDLRKRISEGFERD
ncbi:uncharacterized protein LOC144658296 isoform X2 [Oculina patagonica]